MAPGLVAHEADDPVARVEFTYVGPGGRQLQQKALLRVPDGKAGYLAAGVPVPIAYLPEAPQLATIDWDRLGTDPIV
jgi:hypothetical protein